RRKAMASKEFRVTYTDVAALQSEEYHERFDAALEEVGERLGRHHPNVVGGEEVYSREGEFTVRSPVDEEILLGYFQKGTREDARRAIEVAWGNFDAWSSSSYGNRVAVFRRAADLLSERSFQFAALMSYEVGKNRQEAMGDVGEGIGIMRYYADEMERNRGYRRVMGSVGKETGRSVLKPYGVWGVISPFNFPLALTLNMSTGVLLTGNTEVFKPSSEAPLTGLKLYRLLTEAGVPEGALNFVAGPGGSVGAELVENRRVAGLVFTGSKKVGISSYEKFIRIAPRPFVAELGGKNPTIVTAKADLDKAANGVVKAAFGFGGQKCSACSRVYVDNEVKEELVGRLVEKMEQIRIGDPRKRDVDLGPLINERAYKRYRRSVAKAEKDGRVLIGGRVLTEGEFGRGYYVEPTLVTDLPEDHDLFKEELFVPFLVIAGVNSLDDALSLANEVEYGLTSGIFSEDEEEVQRFFDRIQAGVAYANRAASATTGAWPGVQPFGGWKYSGTSGKAALGEYYLPQFMREQSQTVVSD
ncbi:MAG: aldehyde dehydrogenase family protein, partial [Candidatus Geothermarchaeales archaeon]